MSKTHLFFNEIRFIDVSSCSCNGTRRLYNKHGLWDQIMTPSFLNGYAYLYKEIELVKQSNKKYQVLSFGRESWKSSSSSFIVWDQDGNDMMESNLEERDKILKTLKKMIKPSNNSSFFCKE